MYQLEQPIYFYLLFAIPVLALMALWLLVWRHRTQSKFANTSLLKRLSPNRSIFKTLLKVLVLSLALACFSMALVNPKIGTKLETVKGKE